MWLHKVILPYTCHGCHIPIDSAHSFCSKCWQQLDIIQEPCCKICGWPFDFEVDGVTICAHCTFKTPPYDCARAALRYNETAKKLILNLKYGDKEELAPLMASFMSQKLAQLNVTDPVFVPVPLHYIRLLRRNFNQAGLIAKRLAKLHGDFAPQALKRHKYTPTQGHKTRNQRLKNVKSVFKLYKADVLKNRDTVLVDDVFTTGATANECCKVLRNSGAKSVNVLTFARVIKPMLL